MKKIAVLGTGTAGVWKNLDQDMQYHYFD